MTQYRRVQVTWLDTRHDSYAWTSASDVTPEVAVVRQVGYLIDSSNGITTLACSIAADHSGEDVGGLCFIPNGSITVVEDI